MLTGTMQLSHVLITAVASSQLLISSTRWTSCTVLWWNSAHQLHAPQCQQDPSKIYAPLWERHVVSNTKLLIWFPTTWTGDNKSFFQVWVQMGWWGANQETDWGFSTEICWVLDGLDRGPAWWRIHLPSENWYFKNSFEFDTILLISHLSILLDYLIYVDWLP